MTEPQTFWQQEDKSTLGKIFLMVGVFAALMTLVAIGVSLVL